jgi:hypothetical protein
MAAATYELATISAHAVQAGATTEQLADLPDTPPNQVPMYDSG